MIWPIIDSRKTRNDLMREAVGDLRAEYERLGVRPVSAPAFKFGHGEKGPMLVALVGVVTLPHMPEVMG